MKKQTIVSTLAVSSLVGIFIAAYSWFYVVIKTDNVIWVALIIAVVLVYYKIAMLIIRRKGY